MSTDNLIMLVILTFLNLLFVVSFFMIRKSTLKPAIIPAMANLGMGITSVCLITSAIVLYFEGIKAWQTISICLAIGVAFSLIFLWLMPKFKPKKSIPPRDIYYRKAND